MRILFGPFALDTVNECLWRDDRAIPLTPKSYAVLRYLVEHPRRLVTKEELFRAGWPDSYAGDAVLKVYVGEVRKALGDRAREPQFIETVHRRGYRFIAEVRGGIPTDEESGAAPADAPAPIGRQAELDELLRVAAQARAGQPSIAFVVGETGVGKTTLVDALVDRVRAQGDVLVAHGQCLEHFGSREAYLPVLEAIGRLCRTGRREGVVDLVRRYAPTWAPQLPAASPAQGSPSAEETLGATAERMLREMAEALEALGRSRPVLLVLEDLHWSDYSTLDLVSALAARRGPARLLVVGTYRPEEVARGEHPLRSVVQGLRMHGRCTELHLERLSEQHVTAYLSRRLGTGLGESLAPSLFRRTEGNPLFLGSLVDLLLDRGTIVQEADAYRLTVPPEEIESGVPENVRQMIERQLDRANDEERQLLEAASVMGREFSVRAVSRTLQREDEETVEDLCERLVKRSPFLRRAGVGEFPDGTVSARYGFAHSVFQEVLYDRITPARRMRLHQRTGSAGEIAYGPEAGRIAPELSVHFEMGRDFEKAIEYLLATAHNAARRNANQDALAGLARALDLVGHLQDPRRTELAMDIVETTGRVRRATGQMTEAAAQFETLVRLARERGEPHREIDAWLLVVSALTWGSAEDPRCHQALAEIARLAERIEDADVRAHALGYAGYMHLLLDGFRRADHEASKTAVATLRASGNDELLALHAPRLAFFEILAGRYREGAELARAGAERSAAVGNPFDFLLGRFFEAWALLHAGAWREVREVIRDGRAMAERNGHDPWACLFRLEEAWLDTEAGSPKRALELAAGAWRTARENRHGFGEAMSLTREGFAHLALGDAERAFRRLSEVFYRNEREHFLLGWVLEMQIREGLARLHLSRDELDRARAEATRARDLASVPGEPTLIARATATLLRVATRCAEHDRAREELACALAHLEDDGAPLAAPEVHAAAAEHASARGRSDDAARHRSLARDAAARLRGDAPAREPA